MSTLVNVIKEEQARKSAAESINTIHSNISTLKETMAKLQEASAQIGLEFEGLNAVSLIAGIEAELKAFTAKYAAILDAQAENAKLESELLVKVSKAVDLLMQ